MGDPTTYNPTDRRPIAQRERRWAKAVNAALVRSPLTPNQISVIGMVAAIAAGAAAMCTGHADLGDVGVRVHWALVAVLVQLRLACNMFDGMVAVARGTASPVGELFNEAPDRVSDAAVLIGVGYAATGSPAAGYGAAVAALFVAYVRTLAKSAGAPNDFCGPMAKQQRMFLVTALAAYLAVSPASWRWGFGEARAVLWLIIAGCAFTAARRLIRAARALRKATHDA